MVTELAIFVSVFVSVFALGVQSLNVNNGHYYAAFLTSFVIGASHLALYRYMPDPTWTQIAAYLSGGPLGIVAAMWVHRRTIGRKRIVTDAPPRPVPRTPRGNIPPKRNPSPIPPPHDS